MTKRIRQAAHFVGDFLNDEVNPSIPFPLTHSLGNN